MEEKMWKTRDCEQVRVCVCVSRDMCEQVWYVSREDVSVSRRV